MQGPGDGPSFYRFPRTPHLAGSEVVDDDEVVDPVAFVRSLDASWDVVIQEKVDGTNVSVHFEQEWTPVFQKRAGLIGTGEKPQYDVFRNWVYENIDTVYEAIGTNYCLFGEWLWCKHAVKYTELPSYFLAFDLLEKSSGKFLAYDRVKEILAGKVSLVPLVWQGRASDRDLEKQFGEDALKKKTAFGDEQAEGVYIRIEERGYVKDRVKLRRKTFNSGRESFSSKIINNELKQV